MVRDLSSKDELHAPFWRHWFLATCTCSECLQYHHAYQLTVPKGELACGCTCPTTAAIGHLALILETLFKVCSHYSWPYFLGPLQKHTHADVLVLSNMPLLIWPAVYTGSGSSLPHLLAECHWIHVLQGTVVRTDAVAMPPASRSMKIPW